MQGAENLECCYFKVSVTFVCGQSRVAKLQAVKGMGLRDTGFACSLKAAQRLDGTDEPYCREGTATIATIHGSCSFGLIFAASPVMDVVSV